MRKNKIRTAIIIDEGQVPYLIYDLIEKSLNQDKYEIVALLVQNNISPKKNIISKLIDYISRRGLKKFIESLSFSVIKYVEKFIITNFYNLGIIFKTKNIDSIDCNVVNVYPKISKSGLIYRFTESDIEKIKEMNLDVLVRGGSGILKGKILDVCPHGILSFHHADNNINRGGPPGFWEVFYQQSKTGFIIQRLTEELDGGKIVLKGSIRTTYLYLLNWARICIKANYFLHHELMKINESNSIQKNYQKKPYYNQLLTVPSISNQIKYIVQTSKILIVKIWRKLNFKKLIWGISYQFEEKWNNVVLRKSIKVKNTKNHFFADPFIKNYKNRNIIFFEDYSFEKNKAVISALEINPDKSYTLLGTVLEESFHLSYPYIFENDNHLYMCPESHKSNDIRLYKCTEFPMKWEFERVLIQGVSAGDVNIFYHNEKWWILANIDSSDLSKYVGDEHDSELHIFFSDSLLTNQWESHPKNPVIFNSNQARNAGKICSNNGELHRVFQKHGFDTYGKQFGVSRILELSTEDYKEEKLFEVEPNFYKDIFGTHHFSFDNNIAVIDHLSISRK